MLFFCFTAKWISYIYIHTYIYIYTHIHISLLFWISFPFRSQHWVEFPVLCSWFSLIIYFIHSSVYMPIPNSQFIHGLLLSHKKKQKCAICRAVGETRVCHTEWSKPEREKQISHIKAYIWKLEKWYRWTYLWRGNWNPDIENKWVDTTWGNRRQD